MVLNIDREEKERLKLKINQSENHKVKYWYI